MPDRPRTNHYAREHGSYYFYLNGNLSFMADEVAVAFDAESAVLLKHGRADGVMSWAKEARGKYRDIGLDEHASALIVYSSREWDVERLNGLINGAGVAAFLREMEVAPR